jgi:CheY-like chemotaxis protein
MKPPPTLLIVDDQPENLAALGELLAPLYRVIAATSGRRALQLAASGSPPDLILLDVSLRRGRAGVGQAGRAAWTLAYFPQLERQ